MMSQKTQRAFSFKFYTGSDDPFDVQTLEVPDGEWVLEVSESSFDIDGSDEGVVHHRFEEQRYELVGKGEQSEHLIHHQKYEPEFDFGECVRDVESYSSTRMYVSRQPFGAITSKWVNNQLDGRAQLECARQVHKGELGKIPKISLPRFAELNVFDPGSPRSSGPVSRNLRKIGWARLKTVASLAGMSPRKIVERFFDFTFPRISVIFASRREDIHGTEVEKDSWAHFDKPCLLAILDDRLEEICISRRFVLTILHLCNFGYDPDAK